METQEKGETPARFFFLIASPTLHLLCKDDQCLFLSILASKIEKDITDIMVSNKLNQNIVNYRICQEYVLHFSL